MNQSPALSTWAPGHRPTCCWVSYDISAGESRIHSAALIAGFIPILPLHLQMARGFSVPASPSAFNSTLHVRLLTPSLEVRYCARVGMPVPASHLLSTYRVHAVLGCTSPGPCSRAVLLTVSLSLSASPGGLDCSIWSYGYHST